MNTKLQEIQNILTFQKDRLHQQFGVRRLGIFGSYARNDERSDSDVDILVEFDRPIGLAFVDLAEELERILGMKVDLVSRNAISKKMLPSIENELFYV
ncbi:MAG: nucleotidyltransferase family protein [bacterium]